MKRFLPLILCLLTASPARLQAADSLTEAAVLAAQRDSEERSKRLAADLQTALEGQELIRKHQEELRRRLDKLADEIQSLKEDQSRASGNYVSHEELRKMIEKLKSQLDEQRDADKRLIVNNIKELAKATPPAEPARSNNRRREEKEASSDEPPYVYVIKKDDQLLSIIAEYNDYFQKHGQAKITVEQVVKANPGLNPNLLVKGRKLRIPVPPKQSK